MQVRDLSDVPSFAAVYAAALSRSLRRHRHRQLPQVRYRVRKVRIDPARAAAFDHLVGGVATDVVHPGILHVLAFPVSLALMASPTFPVPLLGLIHMRNSVLQHRPLRFGETVDVECGVQNLTPHPKGATFEAVTTLHSGRDIIATDVSTYLSRGAAARQITSGLTTAALTPGRRAARSAASFTPPEATARWRLGPETGRRYAEVSGDVNPIHLSAPTARLFGFDRAIAHGMYTASRALTAARPDMSKPLRWDVDFEAPVKLPATVDLAFRDRPGVTDYVGWRPVCGNSPARRHFVGAVTTVGDAS
ncbi:MaoC family dehydratase [Devriesea agamarum]|uniref:MaoC family dehydratase n=1 Tax=Devriesea agamarum TaxID=472569 RepID=UPI00071CF4DD|nr:MaoC/PaaZ C-terminal domain-containing protein [Devriesea agamarum]